MLNPTEAIRRNGQDLLAWVLVIAAILGLVGVVGWVYSFDAFHNALGSYGVKIQGYYGKGMGATGTWFIGYENVEDVARSLVWTLGIPLGFILGVPPIFMMYQHLRLAIKRIKELEAQIKEAQGMDKKTKIVHDLAIAVRGLTDVSADHEKRLQEVEAGDLTAEIEHFKARIEKLPSGRRELAGAELAKLSRFLE